MLQRLRTREGKKAMKSNPLLRFWIATAAMAIFAGMAFTTAANARPLPGFSDDFAIEDGAESTTTVAAIADPEVLEPIRPLLPIVDGEGTEIVRPEPCGAIGPLMLAFTAVSLGFTGEARRRALG